MTRNPRPWGQPPNRELEGAESSVGADVFQFGRCVRSLGDATTTGLRGPLRLGFVFFFSGPEWPNKTGNERGHKAEKDAASLSLSL